LFGGLLRAVLVSRILLVPNASHFGTLDSRAITCGRVVWPTCRWDALRVLTVGLSFFVGFLSLHPTLF